MPPRKLVQARPLRPAEFGAGVTEQDERVAVADAGPGRHRREVVDQADDPDDRRGVDVTTARLVVEADVAADDGDAERATRFAHAVDHLGELPHDLGVLGVAEVQAVHQRLRHRADAREVARRLHHRETCARVRVERAEARLAVGREHERARRALEPQHRGVATRRHDGVEEQLVVVLAVDPRLVGDGRRGEQREQFVRAVGAGGEPRGQGRRGVVGVHRGAVGGRGRGPVVHRTVAQAADGDVDHWRRVGRQHRGGRRRAAPAGSRRAPPPRRTGRRTPGSGRCR